jgi:chemotaxis protein CheC
VEEIVFNDFQKDALQEIGGICAGNAASALSQLIKKRIDIHIPEISFLPLEDVPQIVGQDALVVGLIVKILGDFPSIILYIFSHSDAMKLASLLTEKEPSPIGVITQEERSVLKEIGIVLANSYLGVFSQFAKWNLVPRVPELIEDMAEAMVDYILIELSVISRYALLIKSEFTESTKKITGHFFLIPNPEGLKILLKVIEGFQNG